MPDDPVPTRFDYDEQGLALLVEWSDGARQGIPFAALRRACPCAVCAGEAGFSGRFATDPDLHPGEADLADMGLVGSYGLNVTWADGHNTGIYTYSRLRQLGDQSSRAGA